MPEDRVTNSEPESHFMIIAGKCPPEKKALIEAKEKGFNNVELYLERKHIDSFDESLKNCKDAEVEVVSVHTPHVQIDELDYIDRTSELASRLNAEIVVHSQYIHHHNIPEIESETALETDYGYENQPGVSKYALENMILERGHNLVLDTAHLFMGEKNFISSLEYFLNERNDSINVVHLNDSTKTKDGLPFGQGDMDMQRTCNKIAESSYDGILVLEVMPDYQEDALRFWNENS